MKQPCDVCSQYPIGWLDCLEDKGFLPHTNVVQFNEIVCKVPTGVGANLSIAVFVGLTAVQSSNFANFSYDPPTILFAKPTPINANGQEVTFYGTNLADNAGVRSCPYRCRYRGLLHVGVWRARWWRKV